MKETIQEIRKVKHELENCYKELKIQIPHGVILNAILNCENKLETVILELTKLRNEINEKL